MKHIGILLFMLAALAGCSLADDFGDAEPYPTVDPNTELWTVTSVIDGDTIDVERDGETFRVRYIGVNTPERDESCYSDARNANSNWVRGQKVRLERDVSDTDRYGRLLRLVYVGNTMVNEALVRDGWAEAVLYQPDDGYFDSFSRLEQDAARRSVGCHPTGIFNDGNDER